MKIWRVYYLGSRGQKVDLATACGETADEAIEAARRSYRKHGLEIDSLGPKAELDPLEDPKHPLRINNRT